MADAIARMLARIRVGVPFPAEELGEILPGIGSQLLLFPVLSLASGDRAGAALAAVRAHVFPVGTIDNSGRAWLLFAAWHLGDRDVVRPELVVLARRVARGSLNGDARALLCIVAAQVDDPGLTEIIDRTGRATDEACRSAAAFAEHMMRVSIDEVISTLAAGEATEPRSAPAELTAETVWKLSLHELRDRPLPDTPEVLPVMTYRFARSDHWWQAIVTAGHASTLGVQPYADMCHGTLAEHAIQAGFLELAAKHAARIEDDRWISPGAKIAIALALGDLDYLQLLAKHAGDLLDPDSAEMLALALLGAVPPLGLFVARGCIEPERENANRIVEAVERVRDVAGLPPFDRAWHLRERLRSGGPQELERLHTETARLRDELASADARMLAAMRGTAAVQATLEQLRIDHQLLLDQAIEPRERRALRERIDQLEVMIRDGNEERAALRRSLAARDSATRAPPTSVAAELPTEAADSGEAIPAPNRRVLVPASSRAFRDAMEAVPLHVAAEAMRTLGQLAAGDVGAWQCVKQAKDTAAPVYFTRIGIHHRLVFQIDDRTLHVIELVTREALLSTLKRLRGSRRSRGRVE